MVKPKIWGELAVGVSWNMGRVVPKFPGRVGTWGELSRKLLNLLYATVFIGVHGWS